MGPNCPQKWCTVHVCIHSALFPIYLLVHGGFPFCLLISALCLIFILFSAALLCFPVGRDEAVRQRQSSWAGVAAKIQRGQAGSGQTHETSGGGGGGAGHQPSGLPGPPGLVGSRCTGAGGSWRERRCSVHFPLGVFVDSHAAQG